MAQEASRPQADRGGADRGGAGRRRAALLVVPALLAWLLAGCGDPDDGDSGGGSGYLASPETVPHGQ